MSTYRNSTGEIKDIPDARYNAWTAASNPKASEWKLVVVDTQPAFNAATQKVVFAGWTLVGNTYHKTWTVLALTQAEIDANTAAANDTTENTWLLDNLQNIKDGVGTNAERIARSERAIVKITRVLKKNNFI